MEIIWARSPNYRGRYGRKPIAIVDHITAGAFPGCLYWMQNPVSKASAHYLVTRAGEIYQLVADGDTAYTAGDVRNPTWDEYDGTNPNYYTLNIEHEDYEGDPEAGLTEEQYQSSLWLHGLLINKWNIPIDTDHIIGHYRIDGVKRASDPGPDFPWQRLFNDLKGGGVVPEWIQEIMDNAKATGLINGEHNPFDNATKWFVLSIALAAIRIIKGEK